MLNSQNVQTKFDQSIPKTLRAVVKKRVSEVEHLFPGWVNKVLICYDGSDADVASIHADYEYRSVCVNIHRAFFEESDWKDSLIHEIGHSLVRPYVATVARVVESFVPDSVRGFVTEELVKAEEAMVEDLTIFAEKIRGANG